MESTKNMGVTTKIQIKLKMIGSCMLPLVKDRVTDTALVRGRKI